VAGSREREQTLTTNASELHKKKVKLRGVGRAGSAATHIAPSNAKPPKINGGRIKSQMEGRGGELARKPEIATQEERKETEGDFTALTH